MRELLAHQVPVVDWSASRPRIGLFLEMRLGKTLCTIRWQEKQSDGNEKVLVVAPKAVMTTWQEELAEEGYESVVLTGTQQQRQKLVESAPDYITWYITNYEGLIERSRLQKTYGPSAIAQLPWDRIILDESPKIKNPDTHITKVCLWMRAKYKAILTGRPNPESLENYWSQMAFLGDGSFMGHNNFYRWRDALFKKKKYGWDWIPKDGTRELIREAIKDRTYFLSRKEAGVGLPTVFTKRYIEMPAKLEKEIDEAMRFMEIDGEEYKHTVAIVSKVARMTSGIDEHGLVKYPHKLNELEELLTGEMSDQKVVVWCRFNAELAAVYTAALKWGRNPAIIQGGVSLKDAQEYRRQFMTGDLDTLCIQVQCGLYGLNLSAASAAWYWSNNPSCNSRIQSVERIAHPTRKDSPLVGDLLVENSIDTDTLELLRNKKLEGDIFNQALLQKLKARLGDKRAHKLVR